MRYTGEQNSFTIRNNTTNITSRLVGGLVDVDQVIAIGFAYFRVRVRSLYNKPMHKYRHNT